MFSTVLLGSCVSTPSENNKTKSSVKNSNISRDSLIVLSRIKNKENSLKRIDSLYQIVKQSEKSVELKYDDMGDEVKIIKSKSFKSYRNVSQITLSVQTYPNEIPLIFLRINYSDDDWLFIEKYLIKTDSIKHTFNKSDGSYDTEVIGGGKGIKEEISINVRPYYENEYGVGLFKKIMNNNVEKFNVVKNIVNSKNPKIRYSGKRNYNDRIISEDEIVGLKEVLTYYENYMEFYKQKKDGEFLYELNYQNW
jgi:hypothetical protein